VGSTASFTIAATGTAPLAYLWQRNETDIPGATDSAYVISAVSLVDSGTAYRCIVTNIGGSDTSAAAALCVMPVQVPPTGIHITLHALLEGATIGDTMRTDLRRNGLVPRTHPFRSLGWTVSGADSVAEVPPSAVDWVLVELRHGIADSTVRMAKGGFILHDGTITDVDGSSPLSFPGLGDGSYYIVIRHRNHLPVMCAQPVAMDSSLVEYDFRTAGTQVYGGTTTLLPSGKFAMVAGNVNRRHGIGAIDLARVRQSMSIGLVYLEDDCNLDGVVTAADLMIIRNNIGRLTLIE
jgi:hypothetical protein